MSMLRYVLGLAGLGLAGCGPWSIEEAPNVSFAAPFPAYAADLPAFPAQQQGIYRLPGDTMQYLFIEAQTVWRQRIEAVRLSRANFKGSAGGAEAKPGGWQVHSSLRYRVVRTSADSVWLEMGHPDTLFSLHRTPDARLRYWLGSYYLNTPKAGWWRVRRLVPDGPRVRWQAPSPDSLRLAKLPAAIVRLSRPASGKRWQLRPASPAQARQVAHYEGLWVGEFVYERH